MTVCLRSLDPWEGELVTQWGGRVPSFPCGHQSNLNTSNRHKNTERFKTTFDITSKQWSWNDHVPLGVQLMTWLIRPNVGCSAAPPCSLHSSTPLTVLAQGGSPSAPVTHTQLLTSGGPDTASGNYLLCLSINYANSVWQIHPSIHLPCPFISMASSLVWLCP